jgi:hypothetical protein
MHTFLFMLSVTLSFMQMLSCIMLSLSGCGHDLCSCLLASQQLQSAVRAAPVTYSLTEQQQQLLSNPANSCKLDALVHALTKYMPGEAFSMYAVCTACRNLEVAAISTHNLVASLTANHVLHR